MISRFTSPILTILSTRVVYLMRLGALAGMTAVGNLRLVGFISLILLTTTPNLIV